MIVCRTFQELAFWVMDRMDHALRRNLAFSEETITETLLLKLDERLSHFGLRVKSWTKKEEGVGTKATGGRPTGADYDIWFRDIEGDGIGVRIQAKRMFPSGLYNSLDGNGQQIMDLRNNCGSMIPIYLFYNRNNGRFTPIPTCIASAEFRVWGCAFAPVDGIPAINSPSPIQIVGMRPWHELVSNCDLGHGEQGPGRDFSLTQSVAGNLRRAYDSIAGAKYDSFSPRFDRFLDAPKLSFEPSRREPDWVKALELSRDRPGLINDYLAGTDLEGVALIEQKRRLF
ncbi:hypothetical protein [Rhodobacter maris]|uniref:Uncharacterized protein n=1 Tax=Rhodobacter maris TaxID=446682 RepID=A0A285RM93_9RHOB|nr:hypothetical protein [Rhodobacter maris]SOB95220.1 hypothetical protein SAMN05877831_101851 [Rhodobacter maris]